MEIKDEYFKFIHELGERKSYLTAISNVGDIEKRQAFFVLYADDLLAFMRSKYIMWGNFDFMEYDLAVEFCGAVSKLDKSQKYYWGIYYFFRGDYKKSFDNLKENFLEFFSDSKLDEATFVDNYLGVFYERFPEFWKKIIPVLNENNAEPGIKEFCAMIPSFYSCRDDDERVTVLQDFIREFPKFIAPRELLATVYSHMKMWNNCIALSEQVEDHNLLFFNNAFYFQLGWAYGKVKDYKQEERAYRKCLEDDAEYLYALNNLGFSLYNQKKYAEALKIFEQGMENKQDLPFTVNNYVRTLLKMGKNKEAKRFVSTTEFKVAKDLKRKAENAPDTDNVSIPDDTSLDHLDETGAEEVPEEQNRFATVKKEQFSNEKLLEDEVTNRIEKGLKTFGLDLKIYKRNGEYGRQYIIPVGRLDLLCEDNDNNLYIVELKKDSGYDDAYAQTAAYLDWFEKQKKFKDKKIYGIICLNSPTDELIKQVHEDKRMKLFEYQISYAER